MYHRPASHTRHCTHHPPKHTLAEIAPVSGISAAACFFSGANATLTPTINPTTIIEAKRARSRFRQPAAAAALPAAPVVAGASMVLGGASFVLPRSRRYAKALHQELLRSCVVCVG